MRPVARVATTMANAHPALIAFQAEPRVFERTSETAATAPLPAKAG
ncbi:hypothetical protein trd_A0357 (plasmid) [Thermomicrobium roseum DSM 5159]|uniref:Uncharacterized protein n=1 Tax=Thermomicrobium roseum (strain ATCC 27502 / DSM 5159 / P-2) TaxID=309801 RepID=B9L3J3_THERP|nr:hypothetical protein trd_A0357 [Thermomicrobium roseum DSM 5159]